MNLLSLAQSLAEAADFRIALNSDHCLHTLDRFSGCATCFLVCPVDAIRSGKPPELDLDACRRCRACLPLCPTGAYTVSGSDVPLALVKCANRLEANNYELLCELNPNVERYAPAAEVAIRVRGCLAGLGMSTYLELVSLGVERIQVRIDACFDCPWSELQREVEAQIKQVQQLLGPWGRSDAVVCVSPEKEGSPAKRPLWNAESPPLSRRALFRQPAGATEDTTEEGDEAPQPRFIQRLRILRSVRRLGPFEAARASQLTLQEMGFALVTVMETCSACGTCARACPTDALAFETAQGETTYQLLFSPQACIGCDICTHVCAPGAIAVNHSPDFQQLFGADPVQVVQEGNLTRCAKCRALFSGGTDGKFCPVCSFRRQNPFVSKLPPGIAAVLDHRDREKRNSERS